MSLPWRGGAIAGGGAWRADEVTTGSWPCGGRTASTRGAGAACRSRAGVAGFAGATRAFSCAVCDPSCFSVALCRDAGEVSCATFAACGDAMNLALSMAGAITLPRRLRSPASSGTVFVCASPTLTLAIFLCVARPRGASSGRSSRS
jgi:hypothetical protein